MTKKRDLKRRVRERQAQTGENYTAARRRVVAARSAVPVIDLHDVSAAASALGFLCRVAVFPSLAERADPPAALASLREALVGSARAAAYLCAIAFGPQCPPVIPQQRDADAVQRLFERARAGRGGASADGTILTFHVAGRDGVVPVPVPVPVVCARLRDDRALVLMMLDDEGAGLWAALEERRIADADPSVPGPPRWPMDRAFVATLFLIHDGRRYPITSDPFVIGRGRRTSHLAITDGLVSRKHAAIVRRFGVFYIKDLGSTHGIDYKGMRIDSKRIDEGDVFDLGGHPLRFTYRAAEP